MKLQYLIDQLLAAEIKAEPYVDRYGGVVQTMHFGDVGANGKEVTKRYPVACDVEGKDCNNLSLLYHDLVPDDRKNSVVYWEVISPMTDVGPTKTNKFNERKFRGTARLVVWMNVAKLGSSNCKNAFFAIPPLEKILTKSLKITSGTYQNSIILVRPKGMAPKNLNSIFGKYDYNKKKPFYLYPYDYFAIDVEFTLLQCLSAGGTFPINPSIDCPNETGVDRCQEILNMMTAADRCCVLKDYDFSIGDDTDFDCFTTTQTDDLTTRLCGNALTPYSMSLDGINENIQATMLYPAYELERTQATSGGIWVKVDSIGAFQIVMSKFFDGTTNKGWYLAIETTGKVRFSLQNTDFANGLAVNSTNSISAGVWTHIGWTYTGNSQASGVVIYINGAAETPIVLADALTATILVPTSLLTFGSGSNDTLFYKGLLGEARMWNIAKTPANMLTEATINTSTGFPFSPTDPANLILRNEMGDQAINFGTAIFAGTNWIFKDNSLTVDAFNSMNVEKGDLSADVPT